MGFARILGLIVMALGVVIAALTLLRTGPVDVSAPEAEVAPGPVPPVPVAAPRRAREAEVMSPADMSSPAVLTAREAEEAQRRFEKEADESHMMVPDMDPAEMMPPDVAPPMKQ
ncbi:MAG: hypothetical protein AB7E79_14545 [Rhodospirillaceae bacterium]